MSRKPPLIVLLGPTANGKTRLAVQLAKQFSAEIISADSRQVFKGMDIGTGKDLHEYEKVPYHLIDIAEPGEEYNLFRFCHDFRNAFTRISEKGNLPFVVGGTGMYLDAILQRYALTGAPIDQSQRAQLEQREHKDLLTELNALNPSLHNQTDTLSKERTIRAIEIAKAVQSGAEMIDWPEFEELVIGLQYPREITRERISTRLAQRLTEGMIEEVEGLLAQGVSPEALDHYGLEYRFVAQYVLGHINHNDMHQKLRSAIHQFAKQQEKWFRNIAKKGAHIHWLNTSGDFQTEAINIISEFLVNHQN